VLLINIHPYKIFKQYCSSTASPLSMLLMFGIIYLLMLLVVLSIHLIACFFLIAVFSLMLCAAVFVLLSYFVQLLVLSALLSCSHYQFTVSLIVFFLD